MLLYRWETCVKSTSGNDGTYLYFLDGSLTNAIGAMYAKEGVDGYLRLKNYIRRYIIIGLFNKYLSFTTSKYS